MPTLLDTDARTQVLIRAINMVLAEHGSQSLTMRRIAEASGVSTSSIVHHLGSREHLLRVAAGRTARLRVAHMLAESSTDGVLAFLPRSEPELLDTRAWLAWLELWRCERFLGRWIAEGRANEVALLARLTDRRSRSELDATLALIDGLRIAVCAPRDPMTREASRQALAAHLDVPYTPTPIEAQSPWWSGWAAP
jgi:AcrR family transcriptional regulator